MFDLMRETSVEQITVTQICQAAGISRVTFYIYYDDKYMLLDDYFNDLGDSVITSYKENLKDFSNQLRPYFSLKETSSILCSCLLGFFNELKKEELNEDAMAERLGDLMRMMLRSELFLH